MIQHGDLVLDGVVIDRANGPNLKRWARSAWGAVLEVGLGLGRVHLSLRANPFVTYHTVLERDRRVVDYAMAAGILSGRCVVVIDEAPGCRLPGPSYDWILLDFEGCDEPAVHGWAVSYLAPQGAVVYGAVNGRSPRSS